MYVHVHVHYSLFQVCAKVGKYTASIEKREESIKEAEKVYETQFQEREEKQESKKIATLMNQIEEMREEGKKALEKGIVMVDISKRYYCLF